MWWLILLVVIVALLILWWLRRRRHRRPRKKVSFSDVVQVEIAGGTKRDRFNPELRETVMRNSQMARVVGGGKRLAQRDYAVAASTA